MTDTYLNVEQVAKILGVNERTALRLREKGEIRAFKVGRAWRFSQVDLDTYVEQQRQKAEAQA